MAKRRYSYFWSLLSLAGVDGVQIEPYNSRAFNVLEYSSMCWNAFEAEER